jgi:D-sedoheptulose 7-phosphate isomerase
VIESHSIESKVREIQELMFDPNCFRQKQIEQLANKVVSCFESGNRIAFVGNGGSAAEAMHLAAEFTGKCLVEHRPLPAICLNESQSALTAIANDFGTKFMFSRLVSAHLVKGDILIALSTSGKSLNVLNAIETSLELGIDVILWTGKDSPEIPGVVTWKVPSQSTPRIQEVHLMWGHILAELVEVNFQDLNSSFS